MTDNLDFDALGLVREVAHEAAALAMRWFQAGAPTTARIWAKAGGSPVTEADVAVDSFIKVRLAAAGGNVGWLSEETADGADRLSRRFVWVIDPIDGTRAYMAGDPSWSVALALVADGRPVIGIVAAPAQGVFYEAVRGEGAFRDGVRLQASDRAGLAGARITGPRPLVDIVRAREPAISVEPRVPSLAYRIARVADGSLDAGLVSVNAHDWDLAAAHLVLEEAGGVLAGIDGLAPRYNRESTVHGELVASGAPLSRALIGELSRARGLKPPADPASEAPVPSVGRVFVT